jgi:leucyl aminopeptidase
VSGSLSLRVDTSPFERVPGDVAVVCIFSDQRPLRGAAGRADWRLCGQVSDLLASGRMRGKKGEAALVPAFGRLAVDSVLLLGLGRRSSFRAARVQEASASALRRALGLGARTVALAPASGTEGFAAQADAFVHGALDAVEEAGAEVRVNLALCQAEAAPAFRALEEVLAAEPGLEVRLEKRPSRDPRRVSPAGLSAGSR